MDRPENKGTVSWKKEAIKQGYLIKFHRGLLKAPKMQYFVLTPTGLLSFNGKPDQDSKPIAFLSFKELRSIKLDHIELNSCKLSCMRITSKTASSFLLAFSRKEERDEWMTEMMTAFSEALISTRVLTRTSSHVDSSKPTTVGDEMATAAVSPQMPTFNGQSLRRKRRKGDKGSIRRTKSFDALTLNDCTNTAVDLMKKSCSDIFRLEDTKVSSLAVSRKRKSEPDIHVISHFPSAWTSDDKEFRNNCFEHRDSLKLLSQKQCNTKCDVKSGTGIISKIRSKFEYPAKYVHLRD